RKPTRDEILPGVGWAEDWYHLFGTAPGDLRVTYQPYGVVHTYSGYSSISFHPNDIPDINVQDDPTLERRRLLALQVIIGLNFRIENEWKKTYVAIGLRQLRNTINVLRKLTGDPALPEFERSKGWSLSETYRLLDTMAPLNDA